MIRATSITFILSTLAACATHGGATQPAADPLAGEAGDGESAKADGGHDTFGFLEVHKSPVACSDLISCTRYTLNRANRSTTTCGDGAEQQACGVHLMNWAALGLSADQQSQLEAALDFELQTDIVPGAEVLVRGDFASAVSYLEFVPSEVWLAQLPNGTSVNGTYVQVFHLDSLCKPETPCAQYDEAKLNSEKSDTIEGLDLGDNAGEDLTVAALDDAAASPSGAIVVGSFETQSVVSYVNSLRTVDQFYLPVTP